eukprot:gene12001-14181_t
MLHELLLAFLGHTGDIFQIVPPSQSADKNGGIQQHPGTIQLAPDIPLAEEAEKYRLNQLAAIGYDYLQLELFVDREQDMVFSSLGSEGEQLAKHLSV